MLLYNNIKLQSSLTGHWKKELNIWDWRNNHIFTHVLLYKLKALTYEVKRSMKNINKIIKITDIRDDHSLINENHYMEMVRIISHIVKLKKQECRE